MRAWLIIPVLLTFASPLAAEARQARVYRVGELLQDSPPPSGTYVCGPVCKKLQDLGYVEGRNLVFDRRWAGGEAERFPGLAAELVASKPDVIIAETTPGSLAAMRATATIPIVMVNVSDPVGSGLVASLARPGGNVTGGTDFGLDVSAKHLELVHAVVPKATRIAVLMSDNPVHAAQLKVIQDAAKGTGLTILPTEVRSTEEFDQAFASMATQQHAMALIVLGGAPFSTRTQVDKLVELAAKTKLPTIYENRYVVARGGLLSYAPSPVYLWTVAAIYVDKILQGAKPADLPVQQPTKFELVINLKTAKALGLMIPPLLRLRADEVIR